MAPCASRFRRFRQFHGHAFLCVAFSARPCISSIKVGVRYADDATNGKSSEVCLYGHAFSQNTAARRLPYHADKQRPYHFGRRQAIFDIGACAIDDFGLRAPLLPPPHTRCISLISLFKMAYDTRKYHLYKRDKHTKIASQCHKCRQERLAQVLHACTIIKRHAYLHSLFLASYAAMPSTGVDALSCLKAEG